MIQEDNLYGNILVTSPTGIPMFNASKRKLNFYIKNNLIDKVSETEYRLKFEPKGLGYSSENRNTDLLCARENKCVVSGETNRYFLNRHHIVPSIFRKWFPIERKSNDFRFVVLIDEDLHSSYTVEEMKFYDVLSEKYGVESFKEVSKSIDTTIMIGGLAQTLYRNHHNNNIPEERLSLLKTRFTDLTGLVAQVENYGKYLDENKKHFNYRHFTLGFGKMIVDKITNFDEFEMIWLNHFIEVMKPKYLPDDLKKLLK